MRISDLQMKDIVSVKDGRRLGKIVDIVINIEGTINYFVIEQRGFFGSKDEVNVYMKQIKKIGEDVILVEI